MSGRLIIIARFWNDIEWVEASLEHIDYWKADQLFLCDGNWDKNFHGPSTDGTREILIKYAKDYDSISQDIYITDNLRFNDNYRINQAVTANCCLKIAQVEPGDWVMICDCDHFYFKKDIDIYRNTMKYNVHDYPVFETKTFYTGIDKYYLKIDNNGTKLPYRYIAGANFVPTCHLAIGGIFYDDLGMNAARKVKIPMRGMHYEGIRLPKRLKDKYSIGDRKSPEEWKDGIKLKNQHPYDGDHPEFVKPVLEKLCSKDMK